MLIHLGAFNSWRLFFKVFSCNFLMTQRINFYL